jgi:hypothetical protein
MGISKGWTDVQRERVCEWLRANNVDPNDIPERAPLSLAGGRLTTEVFVRDAQGRMRRASDGDGPVRELATFAVPIPPPDDVADLIAGRSA